LIVRVWGVGAVVATWHISSKEVRKKLPKTVVTRVSERVSGVPRGTPLGGAKVA